eukprot:c13792_g1_i2.p1 GENE.c13792_g1_i2~~c13792_g1_i2.p1  ORF type:complete len:2271 (-),score=731.14 c13792_g1_i2:47-6859(-)
MGDESYTRPWKWGDAPSMSDLVTKTDTDLVAQIKAERPQAMQKADRNMAHDPKPKVQPLFLLRSNDEGQMTNLYRVLHKSPAVLRYYLEEIVFPTFMLYHSEKISASGVDLGGSMLFHRRIGFTGTPSDLLPMELGKCGFESGTQAEIIHTLTSTTKVKPVMIEDKNWNAESLLNMIAENHKSLDQPLRALIDIGALITGKTNLQVAQYLIEKGLDADGVVFLGDNDIKMIYERKTGRVLRLEESTIPLDRRFAFYDQVHTTGTDIKHVENAVALCTLGKDMTFRDYAQGTYRMRGIATGQKINVVIVPEVVGLMETVLKNVPQNPHVFAGLSDEEKTLQRIACWLYINQIDSERKQFNFLQMQDLSNVYRRHSMAELLKVSETNAAAKEAYLAKNEDARGVELQDEASVMRQYADVVRKHNRSFKETLNLEIEDKIPKPVRFIEMLEARKEEHKDCIPDEWDVDAERVLNKVRDVNYDQEDSGLAQEQEQEQEEEKEQEVKDAKKDLDVTTTDIAFSRFDEEPDTWSILTLQAHAESVMAPNLTAKQFLEDKALWEAEQKSKAEKDKTPVESLPTLNRPFYRVSEFGVSGGERLDLPDFVLVSNNYYKKTWTGPRRLKNMDLMLEWVPSLKDMEEETNRMHMTPEIEAQSRTTVDFLWNEFAYNNVLKADRVIRLVHAAFGKIVSEEELSGVLRGRRGLESKEELWELLVGSLFRPRMRGRYFVAITLKEAETLRCLIHNTRGEGVLSSRFAGVDTAIALRLIKSAESIEMAMVDRSQFFPDHTDTQLKRAMSTLRFLDAQTYYGDEDLSLLIKVLQNNSSFKRLLFYEQNLKARRRKRENWKETPLGQAINTPSEFKFIDTTALSILIDMAMSNDSMAINEAFSMFDDDGDHSLNPAEMFCALEFLGLHPSYEQIYNWMKVADDDDNMELSLKEFTDFIRRNRLAQSAALPVLTQTDEEKRGRSKSEFGMRVERSKEEISARLEEVQKDLMIYMGSKVKEEEQEHKQRDQNVREKYDALIRTYQEEEEALFGPNPNIQEGVIRYDFQRQNLPRDVEFHGQPDFAPEQDKRYKDQQYFVLDPRAFFLFKPIRGPDTSKINEYSITFYLQAESFSTGMLFSVAQEEEDLEGEDPPSIKLQDNAVVTNLPSSETPKKLMSRDYQTWQLLTVVMDLRQGKMTSYISGERSTEHEDPKVFAYDGGYAIHPEFGLVMFKQPGNRDSDIGIRFVSIVRSALTEDEVKALHSEYGIWQCPNKCRPIEEGPDPWNSIDSKKCWYCARARKRKGDIPEINPDINPTSPTYGITTVVTDNFKKLVAETKTNMFLMAFSPSNFGKDDKRLAEFRKVARIMSKATIISIGMLNLDENELEPEHEKLMPDMSFPPVMCLFRHDKEAPLLFDTTKYELSLAGFLDFFQDNIEGFDFGRYMMVFFHQYWTTHQISDRMQAMRDHLLGWMTTGKRKGSPLRYLSMYLSNSSNFATAGDDTAGENTTVDIKASDYELPPETKPHRFDSKDLLADLVREVTFDKSQIGGEAWEIVLNGKINERLEDMVCSLARHHPRNPGQFLGEFLLQQPVQFDKDKIELKSIEVVRVKNQSQMLQSEVIGSWPNIRKAIISAPTPSATIEKYKTTITPLLERGMPVDVSPYGYSIMYMAAAQGNVELVKYMFAHMANLHLKSKSNNLPVEVAAAMGHLPIVKFLIENGSFFGASLHYAAASGQVPVMKYLLDQGVEPDLCLDATPLEVSVVHGHMPAVGLLLEYGANKERLLSPKLQREYQLIAPKKKKGDFQKSVFPRAIDLARRLGQTTILRALSSEDEKRGMEINVTNYIRACIEAGQTDIQLLPGMDVNGKDTHGWTPLMQAALSDDGVLARTLFELNASYTVRNMYGFSAVMWAHWCNSKNFLAELVAKHGENATALDNVDQAGLDHLTMIRDEAKGKNHAVYSLMDTSAFRVTSKSHAESMNSAGDSFSKKQEEDGGKGPALSAYVLDENDVPTISLEQFLESLHAKNNKDYPGGAWEGNVTGFLASCKLFVQNLLASKTCPSTVGVLDMFALHIYTRSDCNYFNHLNRVLRMNDPAEIQSWKPFSWNINMAMKRLRSESGVYFRGIKQLFSYVQSDSYLPNKSVPWGAFTSSSRDHRVAANFMYGKQVSDEVRGVVFKIWGSTPISLKRFSFFPEEEEFLFAPNTVFKVLSWYEATDANVRRGTSNEGRSLLYVVDADDIVQAVPLQYVSKQEDLEKQLHHNKVVLVELKELVTASLDDGYEETSLQL